MANQDQTLEILDACARRRDARRGFLKTAGGATVGVAGLSLLAACDDDPEPGKVVQPTPTPSPSPGGLTDADVLNFALNLEYLEAQFYSYAATNAGLPQSLLGGTGTQGAVTGGRQVNFQDPLVAQYAREIAADERAHVAFLRNTLGTAAIAQPAIDIGTAPTGAFSSAARAAGLVGAGQSFDPYANDQNFLLGAFIFEDVGVTAYKGAVGSISSPAVVEAAAGIHAAEAYHAGLIRSVLYRKGLQTPSLRTSADAISNARDSLDGSSDLDQGISPQTLPIGTASNVVPTDSSGIAFSRAPGQVLNIVFLSPQAQTQGGFFPAGVNGTIRTSAASA